LLLVAQAQGFGEHRDGGGFAAEGKADYHQAVPHEDHVVDLDYFLN
jgi:hypothetical protein